MNCSSLPGFLEGDLPLDAHVQFEQHLATCAACQAAMEAAMQLAALGAELSQRPDRPHAVPYLPDAAAHAAPRAAAAPEAVPGAADAGHRARQAAAQPRTSRHRRWWLGSAGLALAAAAALAVAIWPRQPPAATPEDRIIAGLTVDRTFLERLPYGPLDRHRDYNPERAGPARGTTPPASALGRPGAAVDQISLEVLAALEKRRNPGPLIAALIARGDLGGAETHLQQAGPGDDLDVERAIVAERKGQLAAALGWLDRVLARSPHHAQATWNRAVVLEGLDLPLVAAEAYAGSAALAEPGWSGEAAARGNELRAREDARKRRFVAANEACEKLSDGVVPDLGVAASHPWLCRPSLHQAVRLAKSRDEVLRLLPVARAIDEASGDTASSALVNRIAESDFAARGPSIALYTRLFRTADLPPQDQARIVAQLRASGQTDLVLGALQVRARAMRLPASEYAELVRLARASRDPYLDELAARYDAEGKAAFGQAIEAELVLRQAVAQCAARDIELRCSYLHIGLVRLYLARHRPTEATETALAALRRSRRLGLYWDERLLFGLLAQAAELARDYPQMRAYIREAELRDDACQQVREDQEEISGAELAELRFASARAELDKARTCQEPLALERARIEAELAWFDGTPARTAELRRELDRMRREVAMSPGQLAHLDAIEGRLVATHDPAGARVLLERSIAAADALGAGDVEGTKARTLAYRTLLVLGARDLEPAALLALFAAAGRVPPRAGCALGALIDGERLLLLARDADGRFHQVFDPHQFKTPDFDARTLVPAALTGALSGCPRVDVLALPPLYGQPRLLPSQLAWSYRGPAGTPPPIGARRPSVLTIEDAHPPAALGLPRLQDPSHEPRDPGVDDVILAGPEATPHRVGSELVRADFAEIHAHGFVDLGISDVSLIALSADLDGSFALTARTIAGLKLARAPFITLAACDAAYTAPYLHEPWSLPYAFLLAGARGVLAPATAIPDKDAGSFFRAVGDQILRGVDPAAVLRDQRMKRRGGEADWVDAVVLFD